MPAYSPDPDRARIPPASIVLGAVVLIIVGAAVVFGGAALLVAALSALVPAPLPPA